MSGEATQRTSATERPGRVGDQSWEILDTAELRDPGVAAAVRRGRARPADFLPPAPNAVDGEGRCVMVHADIDPAVVGGKIIDPVGDGAAQSRDQEVVDPNLLRMAARAPLTAWVLEVPNQFLLLGIDRDDRLVLGQGGAHRIIKVGELRVAIGMMIAFTGFAIGLAG